MGFEIPLTVGTIPPPFRSIAVPHNGVDEMTKQDTGWKADQAKADATNKDDKQGDPNQAKASPGPLQHGSDSEGRTSDARNYGAGPRPAMGEPDKDNNKWKGDIPDDATYDAISDDADGLQGDVLDSTIAQSHQSQANRPASLDIPEGNHPKIESDAGKATIVNANIFAEIHGDNIRVLCDLGSNGRVILFEIPVALRSKMALVSIDADGNIRLPDKSGVRSDNKK